jgi:hypothetical protein
MKTNILLISIGVVLTLLIYAAIEWLHVNRSIPYEYLTTDLNAIHKSPKYLGFLSQLGMPFWFGTAAILMFTGLISYKNNKQSFLIKFIMNASLLTTFLGLDDLYLIHDELSHRGIKEQYFYVFYAVWVSSTLFVFRKAIFKTRFLLLAIALVSFGISIFIDQLPYEATLYEDLAKFFGIVIWSLYWIHTSYKTTDGSLHL